MIILLTVTITLFFCTDHFAMPKRESRFGVNALIGHWCSRLKKCTRKRAGVNDKRTKTSRMNSNWRPRLVWAMPPIFGTCHAAGSATADASASASAFAKMAWRGHRRAADNDPLRPRLGGARLAPAEVLHWRGCGLWITLFATQSSSWCHCRRPPLPSAAGISCPSRLAIGTEAHNGGVVGDTSRTVQPCVP